MGLLFVGWAVPTKNVAPAYNFCSETDWWAQPTLQRATMSRRDKLEQMLAAEPGDVFLHYALACELVKLGDLDAGLRRFETVHEQFPDYVAAWFRHAQVLAEQGETDAARTVGERGLETAHRVGDQHAAGEIAGFLELL
jgi:predicted Zn-dependent protease